MAVPRGQHPNSRRNIVQTKGKSAFAGHRHKEDSRRKIAQALRIRGEATRLARARIRAEAMQRQLDNEAERAYVIDMIEQLRAAEPEAAARLIEIVHSKNESTALSAIRELLDRTRGRPVQTVNAPASTVRVMIDTGIGLVGMEVSQDALNALPQAPAKQLESP